MGLPLNSLMTNVTSFVLGLPPLVSQVISPALRERIDLDDDEGSAVTARAKARVCNTMDVENIYIHGYFWNVRVVVSILTMKNFIVM